MVLTRPPGALSPPEQSECIIANPAFVVYSSVVSFYVPFIVTLLVYIKIYIVLRRRRKRVNTKRSSRAFRANLRAPLKVLRCPSPPVSPPNHTRGTHPVLSGSPGHHSRRGSRLGELRGAGKGRFRRPGPRGSDSNLQEWEEGTVVEKTWEESLLGSVAPFWVSRLSFPQSGPSVPLSLPLMPPSLSFAARTLRPPLCAHLLLPPLLFPTSLLCASLITPLTSYEFSAVLSFP